eukprot:2216433-Pyramimonas_sp.AAC.1
MPFSCSHKKGRHAFAVLEVHLRSRLQQLARDPDVPEGCGIMQKRATVAVLHVCLRSRLQQRPHSLLEFPGEFCNAVFPPFFLLIIFLRRLFACNSQVEGQVTLVALNICGRSRLQQLARDPD